MPWLQRNLVLVVGGAIAVILLGAAGFYLYTGYGKDRAVTEEVTRAVQEYSRLVNRAPSANEQNIEAAITEQKRLEAILHEVRRHFAPFGSTTNVTDAEFKFLLAGTIDELEKLAERYGVRRPADFAYTFDNQRTAVSFQAHDLAPWTDQLHEIRALAEIIYRARVHSLLRIRRASASTNDTTAHVLRNTRPVTNTVANAVTTAYEVVFQGFTSELATVLGALANSPHCFLVKNVNVERSGTQVRGMPHDMDPSMSGRYGAAGMDPSVAARYGMAPGAAGQEAEMASRYGLPQAGAMPGVRGSSAEQQMASRYGGMRPGVGRGVPDRYGLGRGVPGAGMQPMAPMVSPWMQAPSRGPETVLDEQLLRFTMRLDVVRPLPAVN